MRILSSVENLRRMPESYRVSNGRLTEDLLNVAHTAQKDREELMAFYNFPAQHWQNMRTSNPIESTFGKIRHRTKRSKGCLSRDGMLHMMFKLGVCAQDNWRRRGESCCLYFDERTARTWQTQPKGMDEIIGDFLRRQQR